MAADKDREPGATSAEIGKYLDILAKDPNSRVFAPLAEAYRKAGLLDDAVETALEGLKLHPNYLGGRVALGRAYFEKQQFADAAAEMQKVARSAPDNIIAHKVLGQIAVAQGDLAAAEKAFKMVLLLDSRDVEAKQFLEKLAAPPARIAAPVAPAPAASAPQAPEEWSLTQEPVVEPSPAVGVPPPAPAPPVTAPHPYEEIPAIDDLELHVDDIFGAPESGEPLAAVISPEAPIAPEAPVAARPPAVDQPAAAAPLAAPSVPPPQPVQQQEQPSAAMELEVFARVPWSTGSPSGAVAPASDTAPPPPGAPQSGPGDVDSPFETFGRRSFEAAPASAKGEREAFGEIDLESAADEPAPPESAAADEPLFEVFTRQPAISQPPPSSKTERPRTVGARELVVETTAYTPPESYAADEMEAPLISLDEELPRIDLAQELDLGSLEPEGLSDEAPGLPAQSETEPQLADSGGAPEAEAEVHLPDGTESPEHFIETPVAPVELLEPEQDWGGEPERQVEPDVEPVYHLREEIPAIDLAPDDSLDPFGEEAEDIAPEREPDGAPSGAAAGRGVFDTETLASIYVSQGFYRRAAEIYERLIQQRPDDPGLRGKLEDVLSRERGAEGPALAATPPVPPVASVPVAPVPPVVPVAVASGAPKAAGSEQVIAQLQTLLEALKGGRQ
jgi:tetratricopeptide (TPR) repeat protein